MMKTKKVWTMTLTKNAMRSDGRVSACPQFAVSAATLS